MTALEAETGRLYLTFGGYPRPVLEVCGQCEPDWPPHAVEDVSLHDLTLRQLTAVHVMSLSDDAIRYCLPRLLEALSVTPAPVLEFRVGDLKARIAAWPDAERTALRRWADAVWVDMLAGSPVALGCFSDCPAVLDLLDWCGVPVDQRLDDLLAGHELAASMHLADLVEAVYTLPDPFETTSRTAVSRWIERAVVGERLQQAFFVATDDESAGRISAAHRLWTVCTAGR